VDHDRPAAPIYRAVPVPRHAGFESVEVWAADLSAIAIGLNECAAVLHDDERQRAASLRFDVHRERFIRRRWLRRRILSDRFGVDPASIRFEAEPLGRPRVTGPGPLIGLELSTSHAHGVALVSVRRGGDLGVDIARVGPGDYGEARVFMSPGELVAWRAGPDGRSRDLFFRLWTRKEACLKAAGTGLARDPQTVEALEEMVTAPADPLRGFPASRWMTCELDVATGCAAALAIPHP
jgi:4'-phosphopantetheinyl transferase